MSPADGIRRLGFHRWYERQLIESHVYLVTSLLSLILVLACFEVFSFRAPGIKPFLMMALMVGGGVLCAASLRRYLTLLARAQQVAEQSVCSRCGSNGRLEVTGSGAAVEEQGQGGGTVGVQCRKCGHQWVVGY